MAFLQWRHPGREKPLSAVPTPVMVCLLLALVLQTGWHAMQSDPVARVPVLPSPPGQRALQAASLGEPVMMAGFLMLWLQSFDHQPGISLSFRQLDYSTVIDWLRAILALNPRSNYPLLSAARVYATVQDEPRQRLMLDFVYRAFLEQPDQRWPYLAHAVYMAKHRIGDLQLALKYANALRTRVTPSAAPSWALQMELFVLEDMGKRESAMVLLGGLLDAGIIRDRQELRFLRERLGPREEGAPAGQ